MQDRVSLHARKELTVSVQERYKQASWQEKRKILDSFIVATNYDRKYAIKLLNQEDINKEIKVAIKRYKQNKYDDEVKEALIMIWHAANRICSKRLVPFLPEFISSLERYGYLYLADDVRAKLLSISTATVDRLLKDKRLATNHNNIVTTRAGNLIKKQIEIRTFADWDNTVPGFVEADLVAHCGNTVEGSFINTLVLTDIASGWTEFLPLLRRGMMEVVAALGNAEKLLPFPLIGLDTDNGSEFINNELLNFCKAKEITFTRSRCYRKNDQAHVEEKNGSIVRKFIGYDRYEGGEAWQALAELYATLRLYVNFFQPSMKLLSKQREGSKVKKKYYKAETPYQRLLNSVTVKKGIKQKLRRQYNVLDPMKLLQDLKKLQDTFLQYAWKGDIKEAANGVCENKVSDTAVELNAIQQTSYFSLNRYRKSPKPRKNFTGPRTRHPGKDAFAGVVDRLYLSLQANPKCTSKSLLLELIKEDPEQFNIKQLRTLQRRVLELRKLQDGNFDKKSPNIRGDHFLSLAIAAEIL